MSFKLFSWNKPKWIGLALVLLAIGVSMYGLFFAQTYFNSISNPLLVLINTLYLYLTYELLRNTQQNQPKPYIVVEYILTNKVDSEFFEKYGPYIKRTEKYAKLEEDMKGDFKMNAVFVKVENIGETNAVNVRLEAEYEKRSYSDTATHSKTLDFGIVQKGQTILDLVDIFESPSNADYFALKKSLVRFRNIAEQYADEKGHSEDFATTAQVKYINQEIVLGFNLKSR